MRDVINGVSNSGRNLPEHVGLAYDVWAPTGTDDGKIPDDDKQEWLEKIAETKISEDYQQAFKRWESSFQPDEHAGDETRTSKLTLTSRLLVGHGNAAPTEVGLSVHQTWGVPVIPGSALKGLCANYVETCFGPDHPNQLPWDAKEGRGDFQGIRWNGSRIEQGPGKIYRMLFGAPDAEQDKLFDEHGYLFGAAKGKVVFHDALYVTGSVQGNGPDRLEEDTPFAVDVLTVHQKEYYNNAGQNDADRNDQPAPNDYDDPNPVSFLSVRPQAKFLLALSGPREWVEVAEYFLREALAEWGIGGKTAAGYGQGTVSEWQSPEPRGSQIFASFEDWMLFPVDEDGRRISNPRKRIDFICNNWPAPLQELGAVERMAAADQIEQRYGGVGIGGARARRWSELLAALRREEGVELDEEEDA